MPTPRHSQFDTVANVITDTQTAAAGVISGTLASAAGKTTYLTSFALTGLGATGATTVEMTITGAGSGTLKYSIVVPAGVGAGITPLLDYFDPPIPATAVATPILASVPSFGGGNTKVCLVLRGFQQGPA